MSEVVIVVALCSSPRSFWASSIARLDPPFILGTRLTCSVFLSRLSLAVFKPRLQTNFKFMSLVEREKSVMAAPEPPPSHTKIQLFS